MNWKQRYSTDMAGANTPMTSEQETPTSVQGQGEPMESNQGGSGLDSTGLIAPAQGQDISTTIPKSQQTSTNPGPSSTGNSQPPKTQTPKPSGGGLFNDITNGLGDLAGGIGLKNIVTKGLDAAGNFVMKDVAPAIGDIGKTVGEIATDPIVDEVAGDAALVALANIKQADGDENIPGSTQPSLGQNESTMERHVISPFTQPSKQTSDRGTTPQTNSPSNTNAISLDGGQKQNAMNPLVDAISPEGNENIIMNGSKSSDYLEMITKEASDSEIYFKGFSDGRSGVEMDKSLSNLSDDYFNGWQDGKIYIHAPIDEIETHLIDMKPGANALPEHMATIVPGEGLNEGHRKMLKVIIGPTHPDEHQLGFHADKLGVGKEDLRDFLYGDEESQQKMRSSSKVTASVDTECNECGSIRVAHCGTCEGSSEDLKETTENVEGPAADAKNTQNMQVAGSVSCKACYGSGIVCMDCGCSR